MMCCFVAPCQKIIPVTRPRGISAALFMQEGQELTDKSRTLTWDIGEARITSVLELAGPLGSLLPDASPENLAPIRWLAPHFLTEDGNPAGSVQALIIVSQGKRILVDPCIGNDKSLPVRAWSNRSGSFLEDLARAGFPRESIDTVVCTHLHMDHVGWNTMLVDGDWAPSFPNAKYVFGGIEWDHWNGTREGWTGTVIEQSIQPVLDSGLADLIEPGFRISEEVWLEATPGHTPGHMSVRISSGGKAAVITGDLMHHPSQIARPDWASKADTDPKAAGRTRRDFVERYADSGTVVLGTHFNAPTAGLIVREGDGFKFQIERG
jgi:glyoxylase-like metal-dependent hydrolase (beta-lactamase superfamily II)